MYKALNVGEGWQVYWLATPDAHPLAVPRLRHGKPAPYPHRQGAYRRAKQLNDALKKVDEQIARDGAIIL